MRLTLILSLAVLVGLSGCATKKYQWNDYERKLYEAYKDPSQIEALKIRLEETTSTLEASKHKVPPGLYAELGTLYLEEGSVDKAKIYYAKERDAWPESKTLMDSLINNLNSREKNLGQDKK
ncbi:MAG: DUF4810 domain-containing protein [Zwartia sp.]